MNAHHPDFLQLTRSSLYRTTKEFLAFVKGTLHAFVIAITCTLLNVYWLIFKGETI